MQDASRIADTSAWPRANRETQLGVRRTSRPRDSKIVSPTPYGVLPSRRRPPWVGRLVRVALAAIDVDCPALDHQRIALVILKHGDVFERIAADGDHVGQLARLDRADLRP